MRWGNPGLIAVRVLGLFMVLGLFRILGLFEV